MAGPLDAEFQINIKFNPSQQFSQFNSHDFGGLKF